MPKRAFISIGSNIDPQRHLPVAIEKLNQLGTLIGLSSVYQNPAIGRPEQPDFLNAAALILTDLKAIDLREELRNIETELGRIRSEDKYAARTMDLDLCLLDRLVIQSPEFTLPDPDLLERAHLAIPLAELDPEYVHPLSNEPLKMIAERLRPSGQLSPREDMDAVLATLVNSSKREEDSGPPG